MSTPSSPSTELDVSHALACANDLAIDTWDRSGSPSLPGEVDEDPRTYGQLLAAMCDFVHDTALSPDGRRRVMQAHLLIVTRRLRSVLDVVDVTITDARTDAALSRRLAVGQHLLRAALYALNHAYDTMGQAVQ
jgi:hypothetical protein